MKYTTGGNSRKTDATLTELLIAGLRSAGDTETTPETLAALWNRPIEPARPAPAPAPQRRAERERYEGAMSERAELVDRGAERVARRRGWVPADAGRAASLRRAQYVRDAAARGTLRGVDWSADAWRIARSIVADRSGRVAQRWIAGLPRVYALRVRRAALAIERDAAGRLSPAWSWTHVRARRRVALAAVAWIESRDTKRRGMARILVGRGRASWAALFTTASEHTDNPHRVSVSLLFATSHHGRETLDDCGDMRSLERTKALEIIQPPASVTPAEFVGRGRDGQPRALNQYWITERSTARKDAEPLEELAAAEELDAPAVALFPSPSAVPRPPPR